MSAQPAANPLTFEVASIKPSGPDARGIIDFLPDGSLRASGMTLKTLVDLAYNLRAFQVSGGPGWVSSDRFTVNARPESTVAEAGDVPRQMTGEQPAGRADQNRERLRSLLADRFQLAVHRETREQQVYALVVAKGGPKLQESKDGQGRMRMGRALLSGQGVELGMLAFTLSNQLGRLVIDKTSLNGKYDFELKWTPDPGQPAASPLLPAPPGVQLPPPPDPNGPSIFTAIEEQLGLHLDSQKAPVETLVIDHVERPSEN